MPPCAPLLEAISSHPAAIKWKGATLQISPRSHTFVKCRHSIVLRVDQDALVGSVDRSIEQQHVRYTHCPKACTDDQQHCANQVCFWLELQPSTFQYRQCHKPGQTAYARNEGWHWSTADDAKEHNIQQRLEDVIRIVQVWSCGKQEDTVAEDEQQCRRHLFRTLLHDRYFFQVHTDYD